jgi:hypothetical protein
MQVNTASSRKRPTATATAAAGNSADRSSDKTSDKNAAHKSAPGVKGVGDLQQSQAQQLTLQMLTRLKLAMAAFLQGDDKTTFAVTTAAAAAENKDEDEDEEADADTSQDKLSSSESHSDDDHVDSEEE